MRFRIYCLIIILAVMAAPTMAQTDSINSTADTISCAENDEYVDDIEYTAGNDSTVCEDNVGSAVPARLEVTLVTCSPGKLIYELYGHTAIRIRNCETGADIVFNYGEFDFETPHFIWRWVLGKTDYILGSEYWSDFERAYTDRGATMYLQKLDLTQDECQKITDALLENSEPQNRMYRYNYLYNNCATMAFDKIFDVVKERASFPVEAGGETFRDILHEYNRIEPWAEFGVDFVVGAEADTALTWRRLTFAPLRLKDIVSRTTLTDTAGNTRPLVGEYVELKPEQPTVFAKCIITPLQAMILFFLLTLLIGIVEWNIRRKFITVDIVIFGIQGLIGLLLTFLYCFSAHPATDSIWLVIILNPLPLLCLPALIYNTRHNYYDLFLIYNLVATTLFIVLNGYIPQYISPAAKVLCATFALRSLCDLQFQLMNRSKFAILPYFTVDRKARESRPGCTILLAVLALHTASVSAQSVRPAPKLVVGIVVDQLDGEYARRMMPLFGDEGFRRFWYHGYNITNATFDFDIQDRASAVASVYTGAVPYYHGIIGEKWVERKNLMTIGAIDDSEERGFNTTDRYSPRKLQVMTVTDQMKLASRGRSQICSIAANADAAILAGGHDADVVLWMNDSDCQWCSSSYYGNFPSWAGNQETDLTWKPLLPASYYLINSYNPQAWVFSHNLNRSDPKSFKTSPVANSKVTDMAIRAFDEMQLGTDGAPDFLAITLYAGGFEHKPVLLESMELQDTYARIDRDLEKLINHIEEKIGQGNVLFFLTSTGYKEDAESVQSNPKMPAGTIQMERVSALVNLYLSAVYKQGTYVSTYNGNQLYLNMDLIEQQAIPIQEIYENCIDVLLQMTGIKNVFTRRDLMSANLSDDARRRRNALNAECSGDLVIEVTPGWAVVDDKHNTRQVAKRSTTSIPIMLYGAGVTPDIDDREIPAGMLASTVTWILGVPAPGACSTPPMTKFW